MSSIEMILFYSTIAIATILSGILFYFKNISKKTYLLLVGIILVIEGIFIGIRWYNTGHPPMFGTFEATISASWVLLFLAVLIDRKAQFGRIVIPFVVLTLFYGILFDKTGKPLIISEQSYWVYFHALFAWLAYGFYTFSFAGAVLTLGHGKWGEGSGKEIIENIGEFTYKALLNGFLAQTIMYVLGSYYSIRLHGNWWIWDPVEYLFVVSWCLYAIPVHGKILYGWGGQRIARLSILGMLGTLFLYWSLIYFPWASYHIFDVEIKIH